jgi:hypothetical protein
MPGDLQEIEETFFANSFDIKNSKDYRVIIKFNGLCRNTGFE